MEFNEIKFFRENIEHIFRRAIYEKKKESPSEISSTWQIVIISNFNLFSDTGLKMKSEFQQETIHKEVVVIGKFLSQLVSE